MSDSITYTVKQLALAVRPDADKAEHAKLMRRIRHWTVLDHLRTLGDKHTGTGVSREYGRDEAYKALILLELQALGVTLAGFQEFSEFIDWNAKDRRSLWEGAINGTKTIYLNLLSSLTGTTVWQFTEDQPSTEMLEPETSIMEGKIKLELVTAIVINITRLFAQLKAGIFF